jgi:hypothetical protein
VHPEMERRSFFKLVTTSLTATYLGMMNDELKALKAKKFVVSQQEKTMKVLAEILKDI